MNTRELTLKLHLLIVVKSYSGYVLLSEYDSHWEHCPSPTNFR